MVWRKFVTKLQKEKKWMEKVKRLSGTYGFTTVLQHALFLSSLLMSLALPLACISGMSLRSFLTATGIGMIPGTIVYTVLGHDLMYLKEYKERFIILSFVLVILVVLTTIFNKKRRVKH
jgi:uncharacterized membrane protein YdjX (TVP38/TMEM64 family)